MNYTTNYKLPLYEGSDPTSYLTTYNETMEKIDESLHTLALKVATGEVNDRQFTSDISAIKERLDSAESLIETLTTELATTNGNVGKNTEDIKVLKSQLVEQGAMIKNLRTEVSELESFKTAQEQKNSAYESSLSGLSAELSNASKKQDLKNAEFSNRISENTQKIANNTKSIAKNTESIEDLKRGTNVLANFKNVSGTKDGNTIDVDLQTTRENAELELQKWQNAQVCATITMRTGTMNEVAGMCSPVFSRNLGTTNTEEFTFADTNNDTYTLNTTLTFDDTTQNVSIHCDLTAPESVNTATFSIALLLIV